VGVEVGEVASPLRQAEQIAGPGQRGAVVACYYALAYLGFAAPYLAAGLGAAAGQAGAFGILSGIAVVIAAWTAAYARIMPSADPVPASDAAATGLSHQPEHSNAG
jgi:hypothetical protein